MAKFEKGESGNPSGRPKGSQNQVTKTFRELVTEALPIEAVLEDINRCAPAHRAALKIKLLEFVQPKLKSIEFKESMPLEVLLKMSVEERRARMIELKKMIE